MSRGFAVREDLERAGMLSRDDIRREMVSGSIKIYPFNQSNLTGIGYNLSTTHFAFSTNQGILLAVRQNDTVRGPECFVDIPPNDTVLLFSKEYVAVDERIAGTLHSKVSCVCQGMGHVSTTLDPTWKGQLIISINNPTSRSIEYNLDKPGGNAMTLLFYRLVTPVTGGNIHDNNQGRCDLLRERIMLSPVDTDNKIAHLELKDFVAKEYADSLNGYDDFLGASAKPDRYTTRVESLKALAFRLKEDTAYFRDGRYINDCRRYNVAKDAAERSLIESCELFKMDPHKELFDSIEIRDSYDADLALGAIGRCARLVEYELETINHIRRIEWQNEAVEKYAGEESEFSRELLLYREKDFQSKTKGQRVAFALFAFLAVASFVMIICFSLWPLIALATAFISLASSVAFNIYKEHKAMLRGENVR